MTVHEHLSLPYLNSGQHFEVLTRVDINNLSPTMHDIGHLLGSTTMEHGLMGWGDASPTRIHSELVYNEDLLHYFMLGCVQSAESGGENVLYDAVKAASIIAEEEPDLLAVIMVFHAEHYPDTKAVVPLIRNKLGEDFLVFRQKKKNLNEVHNLPNGWDEDRFYRYLDSVLTRCEEFKCTLQTGEILLVDNFKTLHVRTAFSGLRKMIRVRVDDPEAHQDYKV